MAADANITGLSFTVKGATERGAVKSLDNLEATLKSLKAVASGFSLKGVISSIEGLGRAIHTIDVGKVDGLKRLAEGLDSFSRVRGASGLSSVAKNIKDLNDVAATVREETLKKLNQVGDILHYLSGVKLQPIDDSVPKNLMRIMEAANVVDEDTAKKIVLLGNALKSLQGNIRINKNAGDNLLDLVGAVQQISDAEIERIERLNNALSNFKNVKIPKIKQDSSDVSESARQAEREWTPKIKTIASSITTFIGNAFKAVAEVGKKAITGILKVTSKMLKGFGGGVIKIAVKLTGVRSAMNGLKKIGESINALKRIAVYRLLRTAIKAVTDAVKEGTDNAYWYSKTVAEHAKYIAEAYDYLSSATFKMENQLGAAWGTLISAITPILLQIISLVTRAAEAVTRFFAVLGGKGSYLKAVDYSKDWADATDKGAKAAKEWRNQLMGFDEINRLEAPSNTGRSSGNNEYTDYENMFEEVPVDGSTFFEQLKALADSGEWETIGEMLGDKVNELFDPDRVDWEGLGTKLGEKINSVVTTALAFLKKVDFGQIGINLGSSINGVFETVNFEDAGRLFARKFTAIGDVIIGAIGTIKWNLVASKLSDFFIGAMNEAAEWIRGIDPVVLAGAIRDFISGIKGEELKDAFVNLLSAAFDLALAVSEELFPDGLAIGLITALSDFVTGAIETMKTDDFKAASNLFWYKLHRAIFGENITNTIWADMMNKNGNFAGKELIIGMTDGIVEKNGEIKAVINRSSDDIYMSMEECGAVGYDGFLKGLATGEAMDNSDVAQWLADRQKEAQDSSVGLKSEFETIGSESGEGYKKGLSAWAEGSEDALIVKLFWGIIDKAKEVLGIHSPSTEFEAIGKDTIEGMIIGIEEKWKDLTSKVESLIGKLVTGVEEKWNTMKTGVTEEAQEIASNVQEKFDNVKQSVSETLSNVKETASEIWRNVSETVQEKANNIFTTAKEKFNNMKTSVNDSTNAAKNHLTTAWNTLRTTLTDRATTIGNSVKEKFNTLKTNLTTNTNNVKTTLTTGWSNIQTSIVNTASNIVRSVSNVLSGLITIASNIVTAIQNMFNFNITLPTIGGSPYGGGVGGNASTRSRYIPQRMAAGGVVTKRSILEVGEDGREAIIPLENNTQWISNVASQISTEMGYGNFAGDNEDLANDIRAGVYDAVVAAMDASGGRGGSKTVSVNINGREFYRATFDDYKTVSKERGISLISA